MKKAYLIHGWDGSPEEAMHKSIGEEFKKLGFEFTALEMPNPEKPIIEDWLLKIKEVVKNLDEETIFVGHSVGCQAVLRYLETLENVKVGKVILIAPWMKLDKQTIEEEGEEVIEIARPWMETPIDFEKIKNLSKEFICIFSDNDLYVPVSEAESFENKLDAKVLVLEKRGHFDPNSGINSLPEILEFLK